MAEAKFKFTQSSVTELSVQERRTYYGDVGVRGLFVAVLPSGQKSFYVVRKIGGNVTRVKLGRFDPDIPGSREISAEIDPLTLVGNTAGLNVKMARQLAGTVNLQLDRGINPAAEKKALRKALAAELTLREAFDRYYADHLVPLGKRSRELMRDDFARYLGNVPPGQKKPHGRERTKPTGAVNWESRKLSSIQPADVRRMMIGLKDGAGARTANRAYEQLRAIYRKMREWRLYVGDNPCDGIPRFPIHERSRFLKSEELPDFFLALGRCTNLGFRHFVLLSLATGARKSNILGMRWADLDFGAELSTIRAEDSKNKEPMTVPLTAVALDVLEARKGNGSPWVFPAESASGHMTDPRRHWVALLEGAGLVDVRIHDLRRSLGSWAAMQGTSLPVIGAALGHRSSDATRVYARLQTDPVRIAMERAQEAIFKHAEAPNGRASDWRLNAIKPKSKPRNPVEPPYQKSAPKTGTS